MIVAIVLVACIVVTLVLVVLVIDADVLLLVLDLVTGFVLVLNVRGCACLPILFLVLIIVQVCSGFLGPNSLIQVKMVWSQGCIIETVCRVVVA